MNEIEKLKEKAIEFNSYYFDNELNIDDCNFRISKRMTRTRGKFFSKNKEITISHFLMENKIEWEITLLHELIHFWQLEKDYKLDHGESFKHKAFDIYKKSNKKFNIHRTTEYKDKSIEEKVIKKKTENIKSQYIIIKENKVNFIRFLFNEEIIKLKNIGYEVYRNKKIISDVKHCKNFLYLINARYYYEKNTFKDLDLDNKL
jgi:hypothetical protein